MLNFMSIKLFQIKFSLNVWNLWYLVLTEAILCTGQFSILSQICLNCSERM